MTVLAEEGRYFSFQTFSYSERVETGTPRFSMRNMRSSNSVFVTSMGSPRLETVPRSRLTSSELMSVGASPLPL